MRPRWATTQPTRGLGSVLSSPRAARVRARCMAKRSKSENVPAISSFLVGSGVRIVGSRICRQQRQLVAVGGTHALALVRAGGGRWMRRRGGALVAQSLDLVVEGLDVLEVAVDGSEAHVSDFVQVAQFLHHQLTHGARGHFAVAETAHLVHDAAHRFIDLLARHRALLQGLLHAGAQLLLIESLARAVTLDDLRHHQLSGLEGGEALTAAQALTATADLAPLAGQTRVVDLGLFVAAERTVHAARCPK